jgi:hypothetical protein
LPKTTAGFVAVSSLDQLTEHWNRTQVGHLMNDPIMEPFTKDVRRQFEDRWSGVHERLGLTLDDLREVAGGEVDVALIRPGPGEAATTILLDVSGHLQQAHDLLERACNNLTQQGAKKSEHVVAGANILLFEFPKSADDPEAPPRKTIYFLTGSLLGAADNLEVIEGILARVPADQGDSLADVPGFQAVMRRCRLDAGPATPQLRWFVHPLGYADAVRAATPAENRRKGKSILELLQNQGFAALQGVGGFFDFSADSFELVHRTVVYAPPPYEKSMKMLLFPNGGDFTPQRWMPRNVATYSTFYVDILNAFDNCDSFVDELLGEPEYLFSVPAKHQPELEAGTLTEAFRQEFAKLRKSLSAEIAVTTKTPGLAWVFQDKDESYVVRRKDGTLRVYQEITGIWKEIMESLEKDPNGPQINLRNDLIVHLGPRITVATDYQLPITTSSERLLFAIETSNGQAVAATMEKLMKNRTAKRRQIGEHVAWEVVEEEDNPEMPKIEVPKVSVGPLHPLRDPAEEQQEEQQETQPRLLPHRSVTVAHGQLLIASHFDFLEKVLAPLEERETLARNPEYLRVDETIEQRLGVRDKCARMFSLTDEEYRPTYELIRQNKMPEGETMLAKLLNALFGEGKKGVVRQQKIDGQKLPDYDVVRRYLGPAGTAVSSERDGWFFKGFTLSKE